MAASSRKVTIQQVADVAGVSLATVSRALNNHPKVSPELTKRVLAVSRELGYRPNASARDLRRGYTNLVAVVVPDLANPFFPQVLGGITAEAEEHGHRVMVATSGRQDEGQLVTELLDQVRGVVVCSPSPSEQVLTGLAELSAPVVATNVPDDAGIPSAVIDSYAGLGDLIDHLDRNGHDRLAYLSGPHTSWSNTERLRALRDSRFVDELAVLECGDTIADGYRTADSALATGADGLVCFDDTVALGVIARLEERGVRVGRDVSVTGFDDVPLARFARPSLTTVSAPQRELGRAAWRALQARLTGQAGEDEAPSRVDLRPTLQVRESTKTADDRAPAR